MVIRRAAGETPLHSHRNKTTKTTVTASVDLTPKPHSLLWRAQSAPLRLLLRSEVTMMISKSILTSQTKKANKCSKSLSLKPTSQGIRLSSQGRAWSHKLTQMMACLRSACQVMAMQRTRTKLMNMKRILRAESTRRKTPHSLWYLGSVIIMRKQS